MLICLKKYFMSRNLIFLLLYNGMKIKDYFILSLSLKKSIMHYKVNVRKEKQSRSAQVICVFSLIVVRAESLVALDFYEDIC